MSSHKTNSLADPASNESMAQRRDSEVLSVDRTGSGVVVAFSDGRCVLFSNELLYSLRHQGRELFDEPDDDEPADEHATTQDAD